MNLNIVVIIILVILVILNIILLFKLKGKKNNDIDLIERLGKFELSINKEFSLLKENLTNDMLNNFLKVNEKLDTKLKEINNKVEEKIDANFEKTNKTFIDVLERLSKIDEAQKKIDNLSLDIISLENILTDKKTRGIFGEVNLYNILKNVFGEKNDNIYKKQYKFSNGYIADSVIFSPKPLGTIAIDSIYTPIINVKYTVAPCRIAQKTDYESLSLEIITDGSINPKEALLEAAKILIYHFMLFSEDKIEIEDPDKAEETSLDDGVLKMRQLLNTKLTDQDLSVRAINCLKAADIETFADLVSHQRGELLKFRNFGKKSMSEIESLVEKHGLEFGMDISKFNLKK